MTLNSNTLRCSRAGIAQRAGSNLQDARCRALSKMPSETEPQVFPRQTLGLHLQLCLHCNSLENMQIKSIECKDLHLSARLRAFAPPLRYGHCRGLDRCPWVLFTRKWARSPPRLRTGGRTVYTAAMRLASIPSSACHSACAAFSAARKAASVCWGWATTSAVSKSCHTCACSTSAN